MVRVQVVLAVLAVRQEFTQLCHPLGMAVVAVVVPMVVCIAVVSMVQDHSEAEFSVAAQAVAQEQ